MNTLLDFVNKSESLINTIDKKVDDEEKDIEDMDLDEKIDNHFFI